MSRIRKKNWYPSCLIAFNTFTHGIHWREISFVEIAFYCVHQAFSINRGLLQSAQQIVEKKIIKWHRKQNGQLTYIGDISSSRHSSNSLPTWSTLRFANGTYVPALAPALGICRLTCVIPITFSISSFMMSMVLLKWSQVLPSPPIDYNSLNVSWSDAKCGSNRGSKCSADFFNYFLAYTYIHRVDIHSAHEF